MSWWCKRRRPSVTRPRPRGPVVSATDGRTARPDRRESATRDPAAKSWRSWRSLWLTRTREPRDIQTTGAHGIRGYRDSLLYVTESGRVAAGRHRLMTHRESFSKTISESVGRLFARRRNAQWHRISETSRLARQVIAQRQIVLSSNYAASRVYFSETVRRSMCGARP